MLAVAQQREVIIGQPFEKGAALGHQRRRQRRGCRLQFDHRLLQPGDHRSPVLHCGAHVCEHAPDPSQQFGALLRIDEPVDLDVHP